MCGIVGYRGKRNSDAIVLEGLKTLEYRGYDSWGISVRAENKFSTVRKVGKIGEVTAEGLQLPKAQMAFGHTRWATHGGVNIDNAHPHCSNDGKILVVHNGIVENYQQLRDELKAKGYTFKSQTDTEVIPNLIEEEMKTESNFTEAVRKSLLQIEGNYAIVTFHAEKEIMIGARWGSPLVVGIGKEEMFLASDIPAFLEHTREVLYLHDGEIVTIEQDVAVSKIKENIPVIRKTEHINWSLDQAKKGTHPHFMLKEIMEQPESLSRCLQQDKVHIENIARKIAKARNVIIIACGTAAYAGMVGAHRMGRIAKKQATVVIASEFENFRHFLTSEDIVLAISQSGETADTMGAVKIAKSCGTPVVSVINVVGSSLARESDEVLYTHCGPEIGVASTKVCSAQMTLLTLLAYALVQKYDEGLFQLNTTIQAISTLLKDTSFIEQMNGLANVLKSKEDLYVIGRGVHYAVAMESALKIKEVSYIHAEGMAGGELKHGTIALIEKGTPCIVEISSDEFEAETISNAMEIKSRGGLIIGVAPKNNEVFDVHLKVPDAKIGSPIVNLIPAQLLAYYLALARGHDPDKPRNLAKSVTVK